MNENNLLVLCNTFPDEQDKFIPGIYYKDQIRELSKYFDNVYTLIPAPLSITKLRKIPLKDYYFQNVHVHFVKYVDFPPTYFYFRDFWVKWETKKVLSFIQENNIKFNLIHAHNTWRSGTTAIELKKIFKVPVVLTEHTSNVLVDRWVNKHDVQYAETWNACDAIIRVNSKDTYIFEQANVPRDRIYTIPNGFKNNLFFPSDTEISRVKLGLPRNKKILLSVGHLLPTKGYAYMIESLKQIVDEREDFHYFIVGSGKLRRDLEKQVSASRLQNFITFVGVKPHYEIPLWMNACDIFVLPSINEANPTVMFEALACGKPFIGTRVGGVPEIIVSDEYGLLAEPANPEQLAQKIAVALEKNWNRDKIRAYGEKFTWENIAMEILKVYRASGLGSNIDNKKG